MKLFATVSVCVLLVASLALAGPPLNGDYKSTDIGGPVDVGRYSESWMVANGALNVGTTLHAESWDGSALGGMWRYWCASLVSAQLLTDNVDANGNGNRTYMKTFSGGYLWLSGSGPWANGDPDYPGVIDTYVEFETIQYTNWVRVHAVTNVQATAHFDNYPTTCMTFAVGNGVEIGSTDFGMTKPAEYPGLLEPGVCTATRTLGGWWDFITLTLSITGCAVPTEETSWGQVKALYSE